MSNRSAAKDLCAVSELQPGIPREVVAKGRRLGVVRIGDKVHVFGGTCPHHGGPLAKGRVRPYVFSKCPGQIAADGTRPILTCPWHNWEYDLDTGRALFDRKARVPIFDAEVIAGRVVAYI